MPISPFLPLHSLQGTSSAVISLPLKKKKKKKKLYHLFILYARKLELKEVIRLAQGKKPSDLQLGLLSHG